MCSARMSITRAYGERPRQASSTTPRSGKPVRLFKSHREGIADGEQRRDFIYVDDAVAVVRWLMEAPRITGIFNVGTGKARSFRDMIGACSRRFDLPTNIEYIDMPETIRGQYQYFTEARVERLRGAGYNAGFMPLEDGGPSLRHGLSQPRRPLSVARMFDFDKHLAALSEQTVLCIGDLMLDEFVYGDVSRISPEAPAPVIAVKR